MGTHLRVLNKSYPMNTNMAGFRWFSKLKCVILLWKKVATVLEGLTRIAAEKDKGKITVSYCTTFMFKNKIH